MTFFINEWHSIFCYPSLSPWLIGIDSIGGDAWSKRCSEIDSLNILKIYNWNKTRWKWKIVTLLINNVREMRIIKSETRHATTPPSSWFILPVEKEPEMLRKSTGSAWTLTIGYIGRVISDNHWHFVEFRFLDSKIIFLIFLIRTGNCSWFSILNSWNISWIKFNANAIFGIHFFKSVNFYFFLCFFLAAYFCQ